MADIKVELQTTNKDTSIKVNKSIISNLNSQVQSTVDANNISYNVVSNTGNIDIIDRDGELKRLVDTGVINSSNMKLEIFANGKKVQTHKTTTSEYKDKLLSIQLSDDIQNLSNIEFQTTRTFQSAITAKEMLQQIINDINSNISFPVSLTQYIPVNSESVINVLDYLNNITFKNVYWSKFNGKSVQEVLNIFCEATQTRMYADVNGNIGIAFARPIFAGNENIDNIAKPIVIPKKHILENGQTSLFLKNKYKQVNIKALKNENDYDLIVYKSFEEKIDENEILEYNENFLITRDSTILVNQSTIYLYRYIANNILYDYSLGIKTKTVQITCADYYNVDDVKVKNWQQGDIINIGDILILDNEFDTYGNKLTWKVTGKQFVFDGFPKVNLELEQCFETLSLHEYSSGLYQNSQLVYTWQELVNNNLVSVTATELNSVNTSLEGELSIPSKITSIKEGAFRDCNKLTGIRMRNSISEIKDYTFYNCSALKYVALSQRVKRYGIESFANCTSLESVGATTDLQIIDTAAFLNCYSIKEFYFANVKKIANGAFMNCIAITKVSIPNSVEDIGENAFFGCQELEDITLGSGIKTIKSYTFASCINLRKIEIPDNVLNVEQNIFEGCNSFKAIIMPKAFSISSMFGNTSPALSHIGLTQETKLNWDNETFRNKATLKYIYLPNSLHSITTGNLSENPNQLPFYGCSYPAKIYCQASSNPSGWGENWNAYNSSLSKLEVLYNYDKTLWKINTQWNAI